jgi:hypothetical protein
MVLEWVPDSAILKEEMKSFRPLSDAQEESIR